MSNVSAGAVMTLVVPLSLLVVVVLFWVLAVRGGWIRHRRRGGAATDPLDEPPQT